MTALIILFFGTFWESSMDILGKEKDYKLSIWKRIAQYFDSKNKTRLGEQFWNDSKSWTNKWKNNNPALGEKFWGSSRYFSLIMDGWHLMKFLWLMHLFLVIILYEPITKYVVIDILILYIVFGMGHELFYNLLLIKKERKEYAKK